MSKMCTQPRTKVASSHADGNLPKRFVCPMCKRRLLVIQIPCDDGCCISGWIPMHKKKRWWKK